MVEVVSMEEAGRILGCKRTRLYELLADGTLERAPKFGREPRIFRASIDRALLNGPAESKAPKQRKPRSALPESCELDDFRHLIS